MPNQTLYLPGFHLQTLRRRPRSARQTWADEAARIKAHSLHELGARFERLIPSRQLAQHRSGGFSRRRLFSQENTFWAFFSQVLDADGGCREVVRKIQSHALAKGWPMPSSSTSAYCQARAKLGESMMAEIATQTGVVLDRVGKNSRWKKRRVVVVDGTGVSMPDTPANQEQWPQSTSQKPGCGFPQARICACFCLATGALLSHRIGHLKQQELPLLRAQWDIFEAGDILLGDKGFCSYYDVWQLRERGVDSVFTLARRTPVTHAKAKAVFDEHDLLIEWPKPPWNPRLSYDRQTWDALPESLTLRQIRVDVTTPGFRTRGYYLITTLTDVAHYSAADLADLYYRRWDVELFFRDLKTTMGMDILRCRTPAGIRNEIRMHWIVYNALRLLMWEAAEQCACTPRQLSFKASLQALRQWRPSDGSNGSLIQAIAAVPLTKPRGRREPRCVKRRPKPFALLNAPRHEMEEIPHRSRYRAKQP